MEKVNQLRELLGVTPLHSDKKAVTFNRALHDIQNGGIEGVWDTTLATLELCRSQMQAKTALGYVEDLAVQHHPEQLADMMGAIKTLSAEHPFRAVANDFIQTSPLQARLFEPQETRYADRPSGLGDEVGCMTEREECAGGTDELSMVAQQGQTFDKQNRRNGKKAPTANRESIAQVPMYRHSCSWY